MLKYFEEAHEKSDGKIFGIYGSGHVRKNPEKLGGYISEKHEIVSIVMEGFKGVDGYEKYLSKPQGMMYLLDKLTLKDDFLIEAKYLGDKSTDWTIYFDELRPARR